jgi:hypothetical protein
MSREQHRTAAQGAPRVQSSLISSLLWASDSQPCTKHHSKQHMSKPCAAGDMMATLQAVNPCRASRSAAHL